MSSLDEWKLEDSDAFKAVRNPDLAIHSVGRQGWQQLLTWKRELLDAFDRGRQYARGHEVETYHGSVAEAHFRNWLSEFLPKKFGVTAGYIISQGAPTNVKTPAFDVVIYDQLESPVLWAEGHPDLSSQGKMRAIPAEYVKAVIEVKASLNTTSANNAVNHLFDLKPILGQDEPSATYKYYLPCDFTCWTVFFDLRKDDQKAFTVLNHLAKATALRGFLGGLVLRGEGLDLEMTGEIGPSRMHIYGSSMTNDPLPSAPTLVEGTCFSEWLTLPKGKEVQAQENRFGQVVLSWSKVYFSTWPFHLLRLLNAQYDTRSVPSWYGFPPVNNPK
jgi:Domain of unknown function (DUF6602)